MGKASKFFKSLLGFRTTDATDTRSSRSEAKQSKRRWSFVKSEREVPIPQRLRNSSKSLDGTSLHHRRRVLTDDEDPNKHAIALAAATAAVVDAAVAAAQAAAEVVRMTSITTGYGVRDELAAVKIQSCFRGYLARRALRALKALVKLQAVMRGHIVRKQTADMMRRLQALLRAQTRARSLRSHFSDSTIKHYGPSTPEKLERFAHDKNGNRSISKGTIGFDGTTGHEYDKIVEIDTGQGRKLFQHDQFNFGNNQSLITSRESTVQPTSSSSCEVSTPIKSEGSRSYVSGYSDHPNYMSNTESSRAKARSLSAPRLRPHIEIPKAIKRDSGHKYGSGVHDKFSRKAYPGSGRLDRLGMPVYDYTAENEYCVGYWN